MDLNRRTFLLAGATAAVGAAALPREERAIRPLTKGSVRNTEPFYGDIQPGIATAQQEHAQWTSFNINSNDRAALERLLRVWSSDAHLLMQAKPAQAASGLTITFGFGFSIFQKLGMSHKWPFRTKQIPDFSIDQLASEYCDGDIVLQVCGNDRVRVHHATRELIRDARPFTQVHWQQSGFLSAAELDAKETPRNLFGQKDGTANFPAQTNAFTQTVFGGPIANSTSMVIRRIRMDLDKWELLIPQHKEKVIGRLLTTGSPLTGGNEFTNPDYQARSGTEFVIPIDAHMRRAHETKSLLHRRGYNYQSESAAGTESGLMFVSFQSDPATFVKIQKALNAMDALNKWTTPIGSGLYFVPPGCREGEWIGKGVI
jgi:dye decolorizing peroxidase